MIQLAPGRAPITPVPHPSSPPAQPTAGNQSSHRGHPRRQFFDEYQPATAKVEAFSERLMRLNESRLIEHLRFYLPPATNNQ
jgi:hypothetical protein